MSEKKELNFEELIEKLEDITNKLENMISIKEEYESLKEIAIKNDIPLKELYKLEELK